MVKDTDVYDDIRASSRRVCTMEKRIRIFQGSVGIVVVVVRASSSKITDHNGEEIRKLPLLGARSEN